MNTVLIEIICPATLNTYEFVISKRMTVKQAMAGMMEDIRLREKDDLLFAEGVELYNDSGEIMDPNLTLLENGIKSGQSLMLV